MEMYQTQLAFFRGERKRRTKYVISMLVYLLLILYLGYLVDERRKVDCSVSEVNRDNARRTY